MGGPKILASETGTSGPNGQAELLEEGWAPQALEGTNALGKRSVEAQIILSISGPWF